MRFVLVIPVLALFLSNVPFKLEMPVFVDTEMEVCPLEVQEEMQCGPEPDSNDENCCRKETTCICFHCFQVLAPNHIIAKYRFQLARAIQPWGGYRTRHWTNPFIDGPLQPPDVVC